MEEFRPSIISLFKQQPQIKRFDPVLMTSGEILNEEQICLVLKEIEELRPVDERGTNESVLWEVVLPELIMFVFCQKFGLSLGEASDALNVQEEYIQLNLEVSAPQASSTPISNHAKVSRAGRPTRIIFPPAELDVVPAEKSVPRKRKNADKASFESLVAKKVPCTNIRQLRSRTYVGRSDFPGATPNIR